MDWCWEREGLLRPCTCRPNWFGLARLFLFALAVSNRSETVVQRDNGREGLRREHMLDRREGVIPIPIPNPSRSPRGKGKWAGREVKDYVWPGGRWRVENRVEYTAVKMGQLLFNYLDYLGCQYNILQRNTPTIPNFDIDRLIVEAQPRRRVSA